VTTRNCSLCPLTNNTPSSVLSHRAGLLCRMRRPDESVRWCTGESPVSLFLGHSHWWILGYPDCDLRSCRGVSIRDAALLTTQVRRLRRVEPCGTCVAMSSVHYCKKQEVAHGTVRTYGGPTHRFWFLDSSTHRTPFAGRHIHAGFNWASERELTGQQDHIIVKMIEWAGIQLVSR